MESKIKLGVLGQDKVTGFVGIITAHCKYLTGCDQYCLKPRVDKDGKLQDGQWFDEGKIEIIGDGIYAKDIKSRKNGGPQPDAPKNV